MTSNLSSWASGIRKLQSAGTVPPPASKMNLSPLPSSTSQLVEACPRRTGGFPEPTVVILISFTESFSCSGGTPNRWMRSNPILGRGGWFARFRGFADLPIDVQPLELGIGHPSHARNSRCDRELRQMGLADSPTTIRRIRFVPHRS